MRAGNASAHAQGEEGEIVKRNDYELGMMMLTYLLAMGTVVMAWRIGW